MINIMDFRFLLLVVIDFHRWPPLFAGWWMNRSYFKTKIQQTTIIPDIHHFHLAGGGAEVQQGASKSLSAGAILVLPPHTLPCHQCHQYWKQTLSLMTRESTLRCLTRSARLCQRRSVSKFHGKSVKLSLSRFANRCLDYH